MAQYDNLEYRSMAGDSDVQSATNSLNNSPAISSRNPETSFFEVFLNNSELPMDDPLDVFNSLKLTRTNSRPQVPNCFNSQPTDARLRDLEELFLPVVGEKTHACQSRGLDACMDCVFNIDNLLPAPPMIPEEEEPNNNSNTNMSRQEISQDTSAIQLDFHSFVQLRHELQILDIEPAVANHIEGLVDSLITQRLSSPSIYTLEMYAQILDFALANTPSCIISPTGCVYYCNSSFATMVSVESPKNLTSKCIFGLMELGGILSLLAACSESGSNSKKFARCNFINSVTKRQKTCSASVMVFKDKQIWVVAQFIPV